LYYPGEIGGNSFERFWMVNKVLYGLCENNGMKGGFSKRVTIVFGVDGKNQCVVLLIISPGISVPVRIYCFYNKRLLENNQS